MDSLLPRRVSFFPYSEWDADRDCVAFIALVDGKRARCLVRLDALTGLAAEDGAASPLKKYADHREIIEEIASSLIRQGRLDGRELSITLDDVIASRAVSDMPPAVHDSVDAQATVAAAEPE